MEPQLLTGGYHNQDLTAVTRRMEKAGSWKKQRIVCLVPTTEAIPTRVALALWSLAFPPNQHVVKMAAVGYEVGEAYSNALAGILAHPDLKNWEYLLTIEHDNIPPGDGVLRLLERMEQHKEYTAIGGLYFTKGEGGVPQIWGDPKDPVLNFRPQPPDVAGGLKECNGTGMGFTLWRLAAFHDERLRRPWFKTGDGCTQDLYFWMDAKKHGLRCAIDCSVRVGHYDLSGQFGPPDFVW